MVIPTWVFILGPYIIPFGLHGTFGSKSKENAEKALVVFVYGAMLVVFSGIIYIIYDLAKLK